MYKKHRTTHKTTHKKTSPSFPRANRTLVACIFLLFFLFPMLSCSSFSKINIQQFSKTDIRIEIVLEDFFRQYLFDLLGASSLQELMEEEAMKKYLESVDSIRQVQLSFLEKKNTMVVHISSDDFLATLQDLNMLEKTQTDTSDVQVFSFVFSKETLLRVLSKLPRYNSPVFRQAFFPEESPFTKDYAKYIAWVFSEYEDSSLIEKKVKDSRIHFTMKKQGGVFPDTGWSLDKEELTQQSSYSLIQMMSGEELDLQFTTGLPGDELLADEKSELPGGGLPGDEESGPR